MKKWWFIGCIVLSVGCRKATDTIAPVISLIAPVEFNNYNVYDHVEVRGTITDETKLVSVVLSILDENFRSVTEKKALQPKDNTLTLTYQDIQILNRHIIGGKHYLKIEAFDGVNTTSQFVEISINELPLQLEHLFLVSAPNAATTQWDELTGNTTVPFKTFQSEYGEAAVSSYHQYLVQAGSDLGDLETYALHTNTPIWVVENPGVQNENYFTSLQVLADGNLYVGLKEGILKGYRPGGSVFYTANSPVGYVPDFAYQYGEHVLIDQHAKVGTATQLTVHDANTGFLEQSFTWSRDIVSIEPRTNSEVFVLSNEGGQGYLQIYNLDFNNFWEPNTFPPGEVYASYALSDDQLIISHETGLYRYTYSINSMLPIASGTQFTEMKYDADNNLLWCVQDDVLQSYTLNGSPTGFSYQHSRSIKSILLLYNK